jgi:predicted solute-binding protein
MPLWKVKTVAVDTSSRTSAVLARIVFDEFFHTRPDFRPSPPDLASMLAQNDAAVLIGDAALKFIAQHDLPNAETQTAFLRYGPEPLAVFDLAERWKFLTGLPFVFAFWAARAGISGEGIAEALRESREFGVQNIPAIAKRYSEELSLKEEFLREYLTENVHYYMDEACVEGLQLFFQMAKRVGAIKSATDIGPSAVEGTDCEHYAFRQEGLDWQIWIQQGPNPLPRKLVLTTLTDDARPQYSAVMTWDLAPAYNDQAFVFSPPKGSQKIVFACSDAKARNPSRTLDVMR